MLGEGSWRRFALAANLLVLVTALAPGCSDDTVEPEATPGIRTELRLRDPVIVVGDTIVVQVIARNEGTTTVALTATCGSSFLWAWVEDLNRHCVTGCLRACEIFPDPFVVNLAPGDSISETFRYWRGFDPPRDAVPPGAYWVKGGLRDTGYPWAIASLRVVAPVQVDRSNTALHPSSAVNRAE